MHLSCRYTHTNWPVAGPKSAIWFSGLLPEVVLRQRRHDQIQGGQTHTGCPDSNYLDDSSPRSPLFPFVSSMESRQSISTSPGRVFICLCTWQIDQWCSIPETSFLILLKKMLLGPNKRKCYTARKMWHKATVKRFINQDKKYRKTQISEDSYKLVLAANKFG